MGWDPSLPKGRGGLFFIRNSIKTDLKLYLNFVFLMARAIGIDYGKMRTGIAVTDPLRICVNPLTTVHTTELNSYLESYLQAQDVDLIVFGDPYHKDGTPTELHSIIRNLAVSLSSKFPLIKIDFQDEHLTSKQAVMTLIQKGTAKNKRTKEAIDKMSAVIILQQYLNHY